MRKKCLTWKSGPVIFYQSRNVFRKIKRYFDYLVFSILLIALLFFCRSERQKCWSSCYRQWNFNLIMCVFIWYTCLHWQLITTGHLVTVQICWPQSTLLKIYFFCFRIQGQRPLHSSCFRKVILTQNVDPAQSKSCPTFFFLLIKVDLAKVPRSADEHNCQSQSLCGADVSPACHDGKVNVGGRQAHYLGLSVTRPVGQNEMQKNSNQPKDNTLHSIPSPLHFSPIICT